MQDVTKLNLNKHKNYTIIDRLDPKAREAGPDPQAGLMPQYFIKFSSHPYKYTATPTF
jgi:hypothetical protein